MRPERTLVRTRLEPRRIDEMATRPRGHDGLFA